jgi:hypothetical protein
MLRIIEGKREGINTGGRRGDMEVWHYLKYFMCMFQNTIMKPVKIFLKEGE